MEIEVAAVEPDAVCSVCGQQTETLHAVQLSVGGCSALVCWTCVIEMPGRWAEARHELGTALRTPMMRGPVIVCE